MKYIMSRKNFRQLSLVLFLMFLFSGYLEAEVSIFPLSQIKAGMKGKGKTIFVGDKIEEFDVEVLGVLRNFQPKKDLILVKLTGGIIKNAGVIQGMSGSPVYIDDKLVGAVAYSVTTFSKEAIAGITPIKEMLAISQKNETRSSFSARIPIKQYLTLDELFGINKDVFFTSSPAIIDGQNLAPLNVPLVFSGFSSSAFKKAKPYFSELGFSPVNIGPSNQSLKEISPPNLTLREGDAVGVDLVIGDVSMSVIGTVTCVDGNKVLAFGHPLYNLGTVDYAMSKANVIAVVPSLSASFKIASSDMLVGRFTQDRNSGVFGELGKMPRLMPLNIKMQNAKGEIKDFKVKIVKDKILTPFLVNVVVSGIMPVEERSIGDLTIDFSGEIYLENGRSVHLEDLFSGTFDTSITNLSNLLTAVVFFLTNNEFRDLDIHRIDITMRSSEEVKYSFLEKVWLDKYSVSPGERINIKIFTRNFRGQVELKEGSILAPHLPSGSEFYLILADAMSMQRLELNQYKSQGFVPRSLDQLIRILSNQRKNNRIYCKIIARKPGLFLKGEEMPNLPPTMKSMFSSPRVAISAPAELNNSTLSQFQIAVPYVFKGTALIPIKIK